MKAGAALRRGGEIDQTTSVRPVREAVTPAGRMLECRYPPALQMARHHHETGNVTLVVGGWLEEETDRGSHRAGPGSVVVKPAGTEHSDRLGEEGCHTLVLELGSGTPPNDRRGTDRRALPALVEWRWTDGGAPARLMLELLQTLRRCPEELDRAVEEALWVLPDALEEVTPAPRRDVPDWLGRVRDRLHDEILDPPLVRDLAAGEDVHPTYLARRFKEHFGLPVTRYVRRLRARMAAGMIASSEDGLGSIAFRAGFADQSHLCRVFKEEMGMTPGSFRSVL